MSSASLARAKAQRELDALAMEKGELPEHPSGPWCPLSGHSFTCPCRECSEFWGTSAGVMVHQYWLDRARAIGDL